MKLILKIVIVVGVVALSSNVSAQNMKLAHINWSELILSMPEYDSASVKLQKVYAELEQEMDMLMVERNKKLDEYTKNRDNLTDFVRQSREDELALLNQRLQAYEANAQEILQNEQTKVMQPVIEKAQKAVDAVAMEQGFSYVFDDQAIRFKAANTVDLLPAVKKHLGITK